MNLEDGDIKELKAQADKVRKTEVLANIKFAELIELLLSDNKHAGVIRAWIMKVKYKPDMVRYIQLMASLIITSVQDDKWVKATKRERKDHADKIALTARKLAMLLKEDVRPYYPKHIKILENDKVVSIDDFLKQLADYAEKSVSDNRPLKVMDDKRLFAIRFLEVLKSTNSRMIEDSEEADMHKMIAACIAIKFNEEAPASEEVARMLGKR